MRNYELHTILGVTPKLFPCSQRSVSVSLREREIEEEPSMLKQVASDLDDVKCVAKILFRDAEMQICLNMLAAICQRSRS